MVGAVCALAGAFCYSELGINFPSSGGEYVYLTEAFGPTWGFMTGWVSFFAGFSAPDRAGGSGAFRLSRLLLSSAEAIGIDAAFGSGAWEFRFGGAQITGDADRGRFTP